MGCGESRNNKYVLVELEIYGGPHDVVGPNASYRKFMLSNKLNDEDYVLTHKLKHLIPCLIEMVKCYQSINKIYTT